MATSFFLFCKHLAACSKPHAASLSATQSLIFGIPASRVPTFGEVSTTLDIKQTAIVLTKTSFPKAFPTSNRTPSNSLYHGPSHLTHWRFASRSGSSNIPRFRPGFQSPEFAEEALDKLKNSKKKTQKAF